MSRSERSNLSPTLLPSRLTPSIASACLRVSHSFTSVRAIAKKLPHDLNGTTCALECRASARGNMVTLSSCVFARGLALFPQ